MSLPGPLQRVPKSGIDERLHCCRSWIHGRVDISILAHFGMTIGEDGDAHADVPISLDALVTILGGKRPPTIRTPTSRGIDVARCRHTIADNEGIHRMENGTSFEIGCGVKMYASHQERGGQEGMQSQKIIIISIPDKMRIKIPGPGYSRVFPLSYDGRTMEEIAL